MTKLGEKVYHGSTIAICVKATVDHGHDAIPYESPSNKPAQMDSCVLADGSEVFLTNTEANYLNENGVVTFLNFIGGWKLWGNRTAAYPAVTDPKDSFICIRSMMSWWGNREVLTYWQKVDTPMNKRLLTTIISSMKLDINGLAAQGAILGGEIKLVEEENPVTDLIDGKIAFHTWMGFIAPAETIIFVNEFDPRFIQALVAELAAA